MSAPVCSVCGREQAENESHYRLAARRPDGWCVLCGRDTGESGPDAACWELGYERALAREEELRKLVERLHAGGSIPKTALFVDVAMWLAEHPRRK